jgi:hypothetical protein
MSSLWVPVFLCDNHDKPKMHSITDSPTVVCLTIPSYYWRYGLFGLCLVPGLYYDRLSAQQCSYSPNVAERRINGKFSARHITCHATNVTKLNTRSSLVHWAKYNCWSGLSVQQIQRTPVTLSWRCTPDIASNSPSGPGRPWQLGHSDENALRLNWVRLASAAHGRPCSNKVCVAQLYTYIHTLHILTYIHTYIHTHTYIRTLHTYKHTHIYTYIHYILTHKHTYLHTYVHTYIHIHTYTHTHTYIHTLHTYIHTHIYIHYIYTYITYLHTYIHTYIYTYTHTHTHMHTPQVKWNKGIRQTQRNTPKHLRQHWLYQSITWQSKQTPHY